MSATGPSEARPGASPDGLPPLREVIAALPGAPQLRDLHVWRVGRGKYACIVHLADAQAMHAAEVRSALAVHEELVHVTVEFER